MEFSDEQLDELIETLDALLSEQEIIKNEDNEHVKTMYHFQKLLDLNKPISSKNISDLLGAIELYEPEDPDSILPYFESIKDILS